MLLGCFWFLVWFSFFTLIQKDYGFMSKIQLRKLRLHWLFFHSSNIHIHKVYTKLYKYRHKFSYFKFLNLRKWNQSSIYNQIYNLSDIISISGVALQEILSLCFVFIFWNKGKKGHESKMCLQNKLSVPFQYPSKVSQTRKTSWHLSEQLKDQQPRTQPKRTQDITIRN